jgi:endoglucanase
VTNNWIIKFSLTSIVLSMVYLTATAADMTISGRPPTIATVDKYYSFTPAVVTSSRSKLSYSITNRPSWTYLNPSTGNLYGTPSSNSPTSTDNIVISVSDGTSKVALPAFNIHITKASATAKTTISGTPPTIATVDKYYSFTPAVVTSSRSLSYSIENRPSWTYLNPSTGNLYGTPSSNSPTSADDIVISVSDGISKVALPAFNIHITKAAATAASPQVVALSAASLAVAQSAGKVTVTVNRSGGATGAATVKYATSNGTAAAGQNYTAQSGALSWAAGDTSAKTIVVPISSTVISKPVTFGVALASPSGATLGTPAATTVTVNKSVSSSSLAISVSGNNLVDAQGNTVQLRGVNVSGLESVAVFGWSPSNPWGGSTGTPTPDWDTIKSWGSNVVRLPLNEASWLGLTCVDVGGIGQTVTNGVKTQNKPGTTVKADPGSNYQATVINSVAGAAAAGLYVILDLHLAAPGNDCPTMQNAMADADHSIAFWTSVATTFKSSPSVIFELFNEPFLDMTPTLVDTTPLLDLLNGGGTLNAYAAQTPTNPWYTMVKYTWKTAGMQQMLNAVRATGATNVVLTSALSYAGATFDWLESKPTDPARQLGAVWHAYPESEYPRQVNCVNLPGCSAVVMGAAVAIKAAGYPVVITEYGDTIGGSTAPFASVLLPFADANGISYLGWAWDTWQGQTANDLITDAAGDPTQGFGTYVKAHYLCRAAGNAVCQ